MKVFEIVVYVCNSLLKSTNVMQKTIKNMADLKRAMIVGTKVHTQHADTGDMGIREVSISQSNSFAFKTVKTTGEVVNSWCDYGKAGRWVFNGTNVCQITREVNGKPQVILTYTFID